MGIKVCFWGRNMEYSDEMKRLNEIIGDELFLKVCEEFGGSSPYISKKVVIQKKREMVLKEYKNGVSYKDLAKKYNLTIPYIREICNYSDIDTSLFSE